MSSIFTIGHSTRPIEEFINLLKSQQVTQLVDVRTIPKSRHNPQFGQEALEKSLAQAGIAYIYMKELGGLRPAVKDSINTAWRNASFRNYADYMQTEEFSQGVERLIGIAGERATAIMCAEAVPWRCHRSLIGDALLVRNVEVRDIISESSVQPHRLTPFAVAKGTTITYPESSSETEGSAA